MMEQGQPDRCPAPAKMTQKTADNAPIHFRLAAEADQARLVALVNSAFSIETFMEGTRTDDKRLAEEMSKGSIVLAEDGSGQLLACVYAETRGVRGYLGMLAVDPAHQGKGLSRQILRAAEEHLRRQGCEAVDIVVLSLRTELPPIYRKFGYAETGIEEFHPAQRLKFGAECHGIAMSKKL
jgi:ribosomal protein S18 acetylase RimI-like enzyme